MFWACAQVAVDACMHALSPIPLNLESHCRWEPSDHSGPAAADVLVKPAVAEPRSPEEPRSSRRDRPRDSTDKPQEKAERAEKAERGDKGDRGDRSEEKKKHRSEGKHKSKSKKDKDKDKDKSKRRKSSKSKSKRKTCVVCRKSACLILFAFWGTLPKHIAGALHSTAYVRLTCQRHLATATTALCSHRQLLPALQHAHAARKLPLALPPCDRRTIELLTDHHSLM